MPSKISFVKILKHKNKKNPSSVRDLREEMTCDTPKQLVTRIKYEQHNPFPSPLALLYVGTYTSYTIYGLNIINK